MTSDTARGSLAALAADRADQAQGGAPRAALRTLGCRLNQSETATLAALLADRGFRIVPFETAADLVVINSCSVTADADATTRRTVRAALRRSPGAFVAVTGCAADRAAGLENVPGIDLVVGSHDKLRLPDLVDRQLRKRPTTERVRSRAQRGHFTHPAVGLHVGRTRALLKIQDGCAVGCSFCILPATRGGARSRELVDVIHEARALVERGHREIVLTGVNLGSYAQGGADFATLLRAVDGIPGLERLRISSIEPTTVTDAVLDLLAESPRCCPFLHVPVQSGDDRVLERMRRPYRRGHLLRLFERIRSRLPEIALGTDVMVGFPGEDDAAFRRTVELLRDAGFATLHVFGYSRRPGTPAARFDDIPPPGVVRRRLRSLRDLDRTLRHAYGSRFLGRSLPVLFERRARDGDPWQGLTANGLCVAVQSDTALDKTIRPVVIERACGQRWLGRLA